ncbi:hypothetical protein SAMN04489844_1780 [Nocardioides exalbidus]|uniref:Uncharacterized protein n=1 Tax=Nocardioides exalbidus TaxID=402596 RepID=A0A1H4Q6N1_9ACTN|nr:hypothetical protein [Nocardioides exalbidus]SEC15271.1 hypothetical protein SAMN04489844_1780 [Nocardioides exalbidus]
MAPDPDERSSLEMPSFSLRRRKKDAPEPADEAVTEPVDTPVAEPSVPETRTVVQPDPEPEPVTPRVRRELPAVSGLVAAVVTGLVVGLLAVALAWLAGVGCDAARGTTSCGGAIGFPVLVAVVAILAWAGTLLLRTLRVVDAGSTSLLAVGVLAVLVMVFLLGSLDTWWAVVAVPVLAAASYAGSWLLTHAVADSEVTEPVVESHDVR